MRDSLTSRIRTHEPRRSSARQVIELDLVRPSTSELPCHVVHETEVLAQNGVPSRVGRCATRLTRLPLAQPISHPADAEQLGLSDEAIAMYRCRVAEGMYNTREVAAVVARRMVRRGDI